MNLIEAVKSGRPFRTDPGCVWLTMDKDGYLVWAEGKNQVSGRRPPTQQEVLRDDWEIQEPEVTITASKFWAEFAESLKHVEASGGFRITHYSGHNPPDVGWETRVVQVLARRLGLED